MPKDFYFLNVACIVLSAGYLGLIVFGFII